MNKLQEYLKSPTRTEETDRDFVTSLSEYEFNLNLNDLAKGLGLSKKYLRTWFQNNQAPNPKPSQGQALVFAEVEPWSGEVEGESLFNMIETVLNTYLIAPDTTPRLIGLWAAMTYLVDDLCVLPMLVFTSPTKRSGKTTALELTRRLSNKAIMASSISPAALFRIVERFKPTLLLDEADSVFHNNEDLRTLINASYTKSTATVFRVQGDDFEPVAFSTFCPKALALIGRLPDTLADRSISVPLRRKLPNETTERLRADKDLGFTELRAMLARWTADNRENIISIDPQIPVELNDRQADCWREIFRIADAIGGRWPAQVRADAVMICENVDDDGDIKIMLLEDLKAYFDTLGDVRQVTSQAIIGYLNNLEGRPWSELREGRPITPNTLARMLRGFNIVPKSIRIGESTPKGYELKAFSEIFSRYLVPKRNTATLPPNSKGQKELPGIDNVAVSE